MEWSTSTTLANYGRALCQIVCTSYHERKSRWDESSRIWSEDAKANCPPKVQSSSTSTTKSPSQAEN